MKISIKIKKTHFYAFQCFPELSVRFKNVFLEPDWAINVQKMLLKVFPGTKTRVFDKKHNFRIFFNFFKFYELHFI